MADGSPLSMFLRSALGRLEAIRILAEAQRRGELADPQAIDDELDRARAEIAHVLGTLAP